MHESYLSVNPLGSVPFVIEESNVVMGSTIIFLKYFANSKPKVGAYYPEEKQEEIEQYMNWFAAVLRPCVGRITQSIIAQKTTDYSGDDDELQADKNEFFTVVLPRLNEMLEESTYLCSDEAFTIVDIAFYNEITPVFLLSRNDLPQMNFTNLS